MAPEFDSLLVVVAIAFNAEQNGGAEPNVRMAITGMRGLGQGHKG